MKTVASLALSALLASCASAYGQTSTTSYPAMAPIMKYLMPSAAAEIAMARTAAPWSISDHAEVLVLTKQGYVIGSSGTNGWVCFVSRSWTAGLDDPEFWNWRGHGPECLNPPAVQSVLPQYIARTNWAIAGDTREQIAAKSKANYADHKFTDPAPGSIALMLSKEQYLLGVDGPWHPHVMPFIRLDQMPTWGVGFKGSPVLGPPPNFRAYEPVTIAIPVSHWSDGSPGPT